MAKIFALAGAHRTGKTTLAKAMEAERPREITFLPANLSAKAKELGVDPAAPMTADERYSFQMRLFWHYLTRLDLAVKMDVPVVVIDRHPLDFIAYMQLNADEAVFSMNQYRGWVLTGNKQIDASLIVQPGIKLVYEAGKAQLDPVYIDNLNDVIVSHFSRLKIDYPSACHANGFGAIMRRETMDLAERTSLALSLVDALNDI